MQTAAAVARRPRMKHEIAIFALDGFSFDCDHLQRHMHFTYCSC